jgi:response regulator RpfG family c-di-GMP phosphodiesterase
MNRKILAAVLIIAIFSLIIFTVPVLLDKRVDPLLSISVVETVENDFYLVNQIKEMTPVTMVVIIADNADEDEKLFDKNIDHIVLRPITPENLADKVLYMLATRELKRLKEAFLVPSENKVLIIL